MFIIEHLFKIDCVTIELKSIMLTIEFNIKYINCQLIELIVSSSFMPI